MEGDPSGARQCHPRRALRSNAREGDPSGAPDRALRSRARRGIQIMAREARRARAKRIISRRRRGADARTRRHAPRQNEKVRRAKRAGGSAGDDTDDIT